MNGATLPSEYLIQGFDEGGLVRQMETSRGSPSGPAQYFEGSRRDVGTDVYNAFRRAGFSHQQAMALSAEINRENNFDPNYLFGSHQDPYNRATNVGMLSWQGDRATRVMEFLGERGLVGPDGRIAPTPEALDAQAQYLRWEMENLPEYARTREEFLNNPEVDYDTAHTVLGDDFIRWRRTDPEYSASGYGRIDEGYALLTGQAPDGMTAGLRSPAQEDPDKSQRGPLDDLTEALSYLELAEQEPMRAGPGPGIYRPRTSNTGAQALQRFGLASLA